MQSIKSLLVVATLIGVFSFVLADVDQSQIGDAGLYQVDGSGNVDGYLQLTTGTSSSGMVIYSTPQQVTNGFSVTFDYMALSCGPAVGDGFTFFISGSGDPTKLMYSGTEGSALGIETTASNVAVVAFNTPNDGVPYFRVCSTGPNTKLAWENTMCEEEPYYGNIKCPTMKTITIDFWAPDQWGVTVGNDVVGNYTQDVLNTLTLTDGKAYIGFSGGCGVSYATQRITGWTFKTSPPGSQSPSASPSSPSTPSTPGSAKSPNTASAISGLTVITVVGVLAMLLLV